MNKEPELMPFMNNYNSTLRESQKTVEKTKEKRKNIGAIKFYVGAALVTTSIVFTVVKWSQYQSKPIKIVMQELLTDANQNFSDNGRKADGKMNEDELIQYIEANNIEQDDIEKAIENHFSNTKSEEVFRSRINDMYPGMLAQENEQAKNK